ncbi:MAG: transcriptional regulator [Treponema sp.]|nr:transcriptional regulator [Treponema sp.]
MNSLFEDLKEGLQEAIEFEKGRISAKKTTYMIAPVKEFNPSEIRTIRTAAGMTQTIFACYMGVSKKNCGGMGSGKKPPHRLRFPVNGNSFGAQRKSHLIFYC